MIQEVKNTETKIMRAMQMTQNHFGKNREQRDDVEETSPLTQKVNSATTDVVKLEILKLLKELRDDNTKLKKNKNSSNT